jgi:Putative zinc-finger
MKLPLFIRRRIVKRLNCKQVSELVSRQHEHPLSLAERFWLRLHLAICTGCRNFQNNVQIMRAAMKAYLDKGR